MAGDIQNNCCLICSSAIYPRDHLFLDKSEVLFLLNILLEIPQDTQLFNQALTSLTLSPICVTCGSSIKQCKQIYTQITTQLGLLWKIQDDIIRRLIKQPDPHLKYKQCNNLMDQCRQFVKNHTFQAFKYPFMLHDIKKLVTWIPDSDQFTNHTRYPAEVTSQLLIEPNQQFNYQPNIHPVSSFGDPLEATSTSSIDLSEQFKYNQEIAIEQPEVEFEDETEDISDNDDISDPEESSEEDASDNQSHPDFKWNPITGRFHCLDESCSKTAVLKRIIEQHYQNEHLRKNRQLKRRYTCDWPSCGKIFKKQFNHQCHMDKHRGTPSLKCGKCEKPFYYRRGFRSHKKRNCQLTRTQLKTSNPNNVTQYSLRVPKLKRFVKNTRTGKYHCNYNICTASFLNRGEMRQHLINHERTQNKNTVLHQNSSGFEYPFVPANSGPTPDPNLPIRNTDIPCTITSSTCSGSSLQSSYSAIEIHDKVMLTGSLAEEFEDENDEQESYQDSDPDFDISEQDENSEESNNDPPKSSKGFTCTWNDCGKTFARKLNYQSHMNVHNRTPSLKCIQCGKLFYWKRALHQHQNSEDCKSRSSTLINQYDDYLDGVTCTWPGCGIRLSNKSRLAGHMDKHRGTPRQKCDQCGLLFYWRAHLISHKKKEHVTRDKVESIQETENSTPEAQTSSDILINTAISSKPNQIIVKIITETEEEEDEQVDCKVEYQSSDDHFDEDSGPSNFSENETNCPSNSQTSFMGDTSGNTDYAFRQDPITMKYHCLVESCTKSSVSWSYLYKHYEVDHLGTKEKDSFPCEWPGCGKIIADRGTWQGHMDRHKGTPRFKCDKCEASFYWRKGLLRHKRKEHGKKEVKPREKKKGPKIAYNLKRDPISGKFECDWENCGKLYVCMKAIKKHIDGHNGIKRE